eukprot:285617-Chlamydomonas_euryale.AAC.1
MAWGGTLRPSCALLTNPASPPLRLPCREWQHGDACDVASSAPHQPCSPRGARECTQQAVAARGDGQGGRRPECAPAVEPQPSSRKERGSASCMGEESRRRCGRRRRRRCRLLGGQAGAVAATAM